MVVLWVLAKSRWVEQQLNRPIAFALKRFSRLDVRDYVSLLELANGFAVTELQVKPDDWVANKTLVELEMAREGVLVLGIRHKNADYLGAPSGNAVKHLGGYCFMGFPEFFSFFGVHFSDNWVTE